MTGKEKKQVAQILRQLERGNVETAKTLLSMLIASYEIHDPLLRRMMAWFHEQDGLYFRPKHLYEAFPDVHPRTLRRRLWDLYYQGLIIKREGPEWNHDSGCNTNWVGFWEISDFGHLYMSENEN